MMPDALRNPTRLALASLTEHCVTERAKFRAREEADPQFCLEIFRRALHANDEVAWDALHTCFSQDVRRWVLAHPAARTLLAREAPDIYVQEAFTRLFQANTNHPLEITSLGAALGFLRRCVNSAMLDALRGLRHETIPTEFAAETPAPDELEALHDRLSAEALWELVEECTTSPRELRVARLLWVEGYRQRELPQIFGDEFPDIQDVRRCAANVVDRLRRRYRQQSSLA